ncbi:hypothetical protein [Streptomyces sp. HC307]|uniref:hypothetical protein n=1 Tax=Streptomyces flavusporus TaxID=3385496 RepID=UPI003916F61F
MRLMIWRTQWPRPANSLKTSQRGLASGMLGRDVRAMQLPYLSRVAGVDELYGYAWLMFSHVSAYPLAQRFFPGLTKNMLPAALRNPFSTLRTSLSRPVRSFLKRNELFIVERFEQVLRRTVAEHREDLGVRASTRNIMDETATGGVKADVRVGAVNRP